MTLRNLTTAAGVAALLALAGCSSDYRFSSNLDREAINDYFKASDVVLFEANQQPSGRYEILGLVEGEACQASPQDVPVSLADARTDARRKAADKGANGLIIKNCTLITEPGGGCSSRSLCVGQAIRQASAD
ncbi:Rcs stress response system protein RcsF [Shewanella khirikhana]|uniref:Outer membrane lipoprotein RcsF n=1 Tax=Shewanella khirikhana TaxID=1965282 RepID=A0ABM7D0I2_9GAMM|nr:Rcs stress response system protein RcsF [Shewanella khirikhana]AZQ09861.1 Outer membrane lipoprotein RcsF precursor [Shewanella khirikhana]